MTGNFIKNPVVKFLDHSVHGKLKNSNIIDKSGFFVGNYSKNLFKEIETTYKVISNELNKVDKFMRKKAIIFGVTGQDGSYLAKFLLKKGYEVHGIKRRSSSFNTGRINKLINNPDEKTNKFYHHFGDVTDSLSVSTLIKKIKPDEIYNLAAQSHVHVSFEIPEYTANSDALGALRILEAIKFHGLQNKTKYYQAGTSEMFGDVKETPQNENTEFNPVSPYAVSKVFAHQITNNYKMAYGLFACNGILFNHESPVRGETFVTRKIIIGLCKIKLRMQKNCI